MREAQLSTGTGASLSKISRDDLFNSLQQSAAGSDGLGQVNGVMGVTDTPHLARQVRSECQRVERQAATVAAHGAVHLWQGKVCRHRGASLMHYPHDTHAFGASNNTLTASILPLSSMEMGVAAMVVEHGLAAQAVDQDEQVRHMSVPVGSRTPGSRA